MEEGWTEPLVLAFLAAALLLARRLSRRLPLGPVAAAGALVLLGRLTWSGQARFEDDDLITGLLACAVAVPPPSPRGSGAPVRMGP
jgi:drug/metabolite transporter (DMT)-like permease